MFDARAAKQLKAGDHLTVDEAPGLRLVATAQLRTWTYRYKSPADGRMRQIRIGHWPAMGLPAAIAAWERLRAERTSGVDPAAQKRQARRQAIADARTAVYTVRRACDEYLQAYQGTVAPKTYAEAKRLLDGELAAIQDRPAAELTRAEAFDLVDGMRAKPVVAARLRQLMGAVWDRSLDSGRLGPDVPNWWRLVLRGKLKSQGKTVQGKRTGATKRVLTEDELRRLFPFLPNFSRDVQDALTLYLWTACRGSEICAMERSEITEEPDGWWWTIPRGRLKMRRNPTTVDLRVPLVGRAEVIVKRRLDAKPGRYLFPSAGKSGHVEQKAIGVAVWSHMPYAGTRPDWIRPRLAVENWGPHDLRRTARTLLASLGCPVEIAEAVLGHALPGVQAVYNRHGYDAERRAWLTRLSSHLERLASAAPPAAGR